MHPSLEERIRGLMALHLPCLVAIDGPCGSGKSSLAGALHDRFPDSLVIHVDDFFLQPHQRTPARMLEPGGNLDRERLIEEVLLPLQTGQYRGHRRFNCQTRQMEQVAGSPRPLVILEGSYSHHPALRPFYHLTVFLDVDEKEQLRRLELRNPAALPQFIARWIPLENAYFQHFGIRDRADLLIKP